jgi:hypothetical protein
VITIKMRVASLILAVSAFMAVAGTAVALQARATLRCYQLGREQETMECIGLEIESVRSRLAERFSPAWVHQAGVRLRELRSGQNERTTF